MAFLRDGDQLFLDLLPREPWGGRSPRELTRGFALLSSRQEPPRHEVFFAADQLELWMVDRPHGEKGPRMYSGAPLLQECRGPRLRPTGRLEVEEGLWLTEDGTRRR